MTSNYNPRAGGAKETKGVSRFCVLGGPKGDTPRFSPEKLGDYLTYQWPAAKDPGGRLYVYHDHAWQPDGEEFYRTKMRGLLRPGWKAQYAAETLTWLQATELRIDESPPADTMRVRNGILRVKSTHIDYEPFNDLDPTPISPVVLPVHYDQEASCSRFQSYLQAALPDRRMQLLAQELMGYTLVPDNSQQKAFLFVGAGGNGKSTLINVMRALVGEANCSTVALHEFGDKFAAADMYGKLLNTSTERRGRELSTSDLFLKVTGGDAIRGERKYEHAFDFKPFARLVFAMNDYPAIADPNAAFWDRWVVVRFPVRFRDTAQDNKALTRQLTDRHELSGILNFALRGLVRLRKRGYFKLPQPAIADLDEFKVRADQVQQFIRDHHGQGWYPQAEAWRDYQEWRIETGHEGLNKSNFLQRMRTVLGTPTARNGYPGWTL